MRGRYWARRAAAIIIFILVAIFAVRYSQENNYGAGARETSQAPNQETLEVAFVANSVDGSLSIVDLQQQQVIKVLNVTPDGKQVGFFRDPLQFIAQPVAEGKGGLNYVQDTDLSKDGSVIFVSRGWLADVVAIDIQTNVILWRSKISGIRADHMDISPDGRKLYVSAVIYGGNTVQVLDTYDGRTIAEIPAGPWPHDVHVSTDNSTVFVASLGDMETPLSERNPKGNAYRISIADTESYRVNRELFFPEGVRPFQVAGQKGIIYLQLSNSHDVFAYDIETGTQKGFLEMPVGMGVQVSDWDFEAPHHGLALTKDHEKLCIAGRASDYAGIATTVPLKLNHTVPIGNAPSWAALTADDSVCLLANNRSDDVSIVDMENGVELARIPVGRAPKHITVGQISGMR